MLVLFTFITNQTARSFFQRQKGTVEAAARGDARHRSPSPLAPVPGSARAGHCRAHDGAAEHVQSRRAALRLGPPAADVATPPTALRAPHAAAPVLSEVPAPQRAGSRVPAPDPKIANMKEIPLYYYYYINKKIIIIIIIYIYILYIYNIYILYNSYAV